MLEDSGRPPPKPSSLCVRKPRVQIHNRLLVHFPIWVENESHRAFSPPLTDTLSSPHDCTTTARSIRRIHIRTPSPWTCHIPGTGVLPFRSVRRTHPIDDIPTIRPIRVIALIPLRKPRDLLLFALQVQWDPNLQKTYRQGTPAQSSSASDDAYIVPVSRAASP